MAMIKENNYYINYYTIEGVQAWVKTGQYKNTNGDIKEVITSLVITKEGTKEVIYKYISYNGFISYYYNEDGFSLSDIIEDLLIYIAHNKTDKYYKNRFIESALNNGYKGLSILKRFKKEYEEEQKEVVRIQELKQLEKQKTELLKEVDKIVNDINNKIEIRFIKPNKYNNYNYEFFTRKSYKLFETGGHIKEDVQGVTNMLKKKKKYNNLLNSDIVPEKFLIFDKIVA